MGKTSETEQNTGDAVLLAAVRKKAAYCIRKLKKAGAFPGKIKSYGLYMRPSAYGQCTLNPDGTYTVLISRPLVLTADRHPEMFASAVAHEILHTCPGCFNHGPLFRAFSEKIKKNGGPDCLLSEEDSSYLWKYTQKQTYAGVCTECGETYRWQYRCAAFRDTEKGYSLCRLCGAQLQAYLYSGGRRKKDPSAVQIRGKYRGTDGEKICGGEEKRLCG